MRFSAIPQQAVVTPKNPWVRGLYYLSTEGDEVDVTNTLTEPTTVDSSTPTANKALVRCVGNYTRLAFIGTDAANETFTCSIYSWSRQVHDVDSASATPGAQDWAPSLPELVLTVTLGAKTGVAGGVVTASELYADTIVITTDNSPSSRVVDRFSLANDGRAEIVLDNLGDDYFEVQFDLGTCASAGCLSKWF